MKPFTDLNNRLAVAALFLGSSIADDRSPRFAREYLRDRRAQAEDAASSSSSSLLSTDSSPAQMTRDSTPSVTTRTAESILMSRRMAETTPKCQSYIDQFPVKTSCISSATEFESYMQDETVFAMLLCDGFAYSPTTEMGLYEQYKTVVCEGVCKIDGSKIDEETQSAFVVSNNTSLDFCGVDFENFFFGQSRVFSLKGADTSANFQSCNFRNNGYSVPTIKTGGVMRIAQSTVSFIECAFHGNQASQGGVIQALRGSAVTVMDSHFDSNLGILGGVITISPGVIANFVRSKIEKSMARFGAVVAYVGGGTVQFTDSTIRDNRATALGGVAFLSMGFAPSIHFAGSSMANNTADSKGGVLYASAGTRSTFTDCEAAMNTAGDEGGAVYAEQESNIVLASSNFVGNKALMRRSHRMGILPAESKNATKGDHIFLDSADAKLVSCSTGSNTFADPGEDKGVKFMNGKNACI